MRFLNICLIQLFFAHSKAILSVDSGYLRKEISFFKQKPRNIPDYKTFH